MMHTLPRRERRNSWLYIAMFILAAAITFKVAERVEVADMENLPVDYN